MRVYRDKHNCFHAFSNIVLLTCMKYLHYVCQKYVVALEATGIIKTERLANPCSISFANPTFTFSLVVWDKFCGQGAKNTCSTSKRNMAAPGQKILTQLLQEILLHLGQVHQGRMKMHRKNREPGKSLKAVSWASNSKLLFPTKQDFLFIFSIIFQSLFLNINCRTSVPNGPHIVWQRAIKNIFLLWNNFLPQMYQALI